jgi:hypothetical protein
LVAMLVWPPLLIDTRMECNLRSPKILLHRFLLTNLTGIDRK